MYGGYIRKEGHTQPWGNRMLLEIALTLDPREICVLTGIPRSHETTTPPHPTVGMCLGPDGCPRGLAFSYEQGTPVCASDV